MEDTHWDAHVSLPSSFFCLNPCFNGRYSLSIEEKFDQQGFTEVLILVLMEDTHWVKKSSGRRSKKVLILVLMEDTHWELYNTEEQHSPWCLNPCFNGRYSLRALSDPYVGSSASLNPCFNGRYSLRRLYDEYLKSLGRLNPCFNGRYSLRASSEA